MEQLLPVQATDTDTLAEHWDYIYEPEAKKILEELLKRYVESQVVWPAARRRERRLRDGRAHGCHEGGIR